MLKFILLLTLTSAELIIKNVDTIPLTLRILNGANGFSYRYRMHSGDVKKMSFYGRAIRLWAEWSDYSLDKGFTLVEYTRILKNEVAGVIDISFVDGFNSNVKLLSNKINITTNFGINTCDTAGGQNHLDDNICLSPCSLWNIDFICCYGDYGTPQTCTNNGEPISNENKRWRDTIRSVVTPPRVYTYAYDDNSGTISNPSDTIEIQFYRVGIISMIN